MGLPVVDFVCVFAVYCILLFALFGSVWFGWLITLPVAITFRFGLLDEVCFACWLVVVSLWVVFVGDCFACAIC